MSPEAPNCGAINPPPERRIHHVPVEGRKIAVSVLPSPSKSPGAAMSVDSPQFKAVNPAVERLRYQLPSDGRNTERSVFPSPSKSARDRGVGAMSVTVKLASDISKKTFPTASIFIRP